MKTIFGFQEFIDVVQSRLKSTNENSNAFRENKRDCKAIFVIHQCDRQTKISG
ncbi:hypothetical protein Lalb_Chr18g0047981 [Lupinus albus]|uniref:Uncharacterized protein n=1 Tax=Lupinus albus TaxID=3870 RepID=A0A6A4P176_LUPAL|nr:hypothetical protein Lalb_Chr18g0047981 [Lupinus albus]